MTYQFLLHRHRDVVISLLLTVWSMSLSPGTYLHFCSPPAPASATRDRRETQDQPEIRPHIVKLQLVDSAGIIVYVFARLPPNFSWQM